MFVKLGEEENTAILEEINPLLEGSPFDPVTATILAQDVSFYPGYRFLDINDYETVPHKRKFALYKPGNAVALNWTNEPVYMLNEKAPLQLNADNVAAYVRFFFTYVRGHHGRFVIIETADEIAWREDPPPAARRAVSEMICPMTVTDHDSDGTYHLIACMIFKDSLFKSQVHVTAGGLVSLSDESLLIEDMPVLDDTFGQ
ncbi:MAG: hypothetical protein H6868_01950 [Rhodospirillales bacterium]|nr:hypothetical protein [Rhodospirillales bacterium]